jgi:hypothetical protein
LWEYDVFFFYYYREIEQNRREKLQPVKPSGFQKPTSIPLVFALVVLKQSF